MSAAASVAAAPTASATPAAASSSSSSSSSAKTLVAAAVSGSSDSKAASAAAACGSAASSSSSSSATATATATTSSAPLPPLPWSYDDFTVPVGSIVADARVSVVKDAHGHPVLPYAFRPLTLRGVTFPNRFAVSPMCQYSCAHGAMTDWHLMHYGKFAAYGAGLVMLEMTAVQARGRISPYCSGLWDDAHVAPLKRIVEFVHSQGACRAGIQLAHAGRKASQLPPFMIRRGGPINARDDQGGWAADVVGPSPVAFDTNWLTPRAMTPDDIRQVVADFASAAKRADAAGFDVVELHGAHGYLLNAFASALSNHRTDAYGGSFENRTRLICEVTSAVRAVWPPHKPLFVRLSCIDWVDASLGGWDMAQTVALVTRLLALGADVIDCSSGGNHPKQRIVSGPLYQVGFSAALRQTNTTVVTAAVGEITTPQQCEDVVGTGKADLVFLGRQLLREPTFVLRAAKELKVPVAWAPQYLRAKL